MQNCGSVELRVRNLPCRFASFSCGATREKRNLPVSQICGLCLNGGQQDYNFPEIPEMHFASSFFFSLLHLYRTCWHIGLECTRLLYNHCFPTTCSQPLGPSRYW
uniref:Uncharacterized protein n=1 Tax=Anguilla anguilla TaxID=7936 RepID=A0A0E9XC17_ANGAN